MPVRRLLRGTVPREDLEGVFAEFARTHAAGLAHGDLRGENVPVLDGVPHFIDATSVDPAALRRAEAFLRFATLRPDLVFDGRAVRGEVRRATAVE